MKKLFVLFLIPLSACSTLSNWLTPDLSPRAVARRECVDWISRHNLMQRPRAGTKLWYQLVDACVDKHTSIAAEIDNALK